MNTKSIFLLLDCLLLSLIKGQSADVCDGSFNQFLQCMSKDAETRIDNYNKEITPSAQSKVQQCFSQQGCTPPDFTQAQVGFFVQEPWTSRINAFLDVLENMDPKVQRCMTDYFKGIMAAKINECIKKHGPPDVKNFQMPPIPGGYNLDMKKMKTVLLDRMMVQYQLSQCVAGGSPQSQNVGGCVKAARQEADDGGMCKTRENCVHDNIKDKKCLDRFNKIHSTACQCFNNEQGQKDIEKDVKNTILSGALEKKYKECHQQNGVPYPKDKVETAKKAAKDGFLEILSNQGKMPPGVDAAMNVGKQVMAEMGEQWKGAFCAECNADPTPNPLVQVAPQVQLQPQPQLAVSPLINNNQFQPAVSGASLGGGGAGRFVVPPPLPGASANVAAFPAAFPGANANAPPQPVPNQFAALPQQPQFQPQQTQVGNAQQLSFEDFKQKLAQTFGSNG